MASTGIDSTDYYQAHEVQDLLAAMSDTERTQILISYKLLGCEQRVGFTPMDVYGQVVEGALSMSRKWKKGLSAVTFFRNTGRSVISNESERCKQTMLVPTIGAEYDDTGELGRDLDMSNISPHESEQQIAEQRESDEIIKQWCEKVMGYFEQDEQALCFLRHKFDERKKIAILQLCCFTDQVYRNVVKRVKDKLRKRIPNGLPWWEIES